MDDTILDAIVRDGFSLSTSCYYEKRLRSEYRELQKKFPRILQPNRQTLDEIATTLNVTENELRQALLNHVCKTKREQNLNDCERFFYEQELYDTKHDLLTWLLEYYAIDVTPEQFKTVLENVELSQLEMDLNLIYGVTPCEN